MTQVGQELVACTFETHTITLFTRLLSHEEMNKNIKFLRTTLQGVHELATMFY